MGVVQKGQTIQHSGVGGHHHNNPAENGIKIIIQKAQTMMSVICWPERTDLALWPLAIQHAVHLHNELPNPSSGLAPIEVWSASKSSYSAVRNAQPWGCPVYVLQPKLQNGQKNPKLEPRSRQGQYVGDSPLHASTVGLVRNLKTNNISPQYHVVYDSYFETVHSDSLTQPEVWDELLIFNRYQANFDENEYVPELSNEWLSPEQIIAKQESDLPEGEDKPKARSTGEEDSNNEVSSSEIQVEEESSVLNIQSPQN